MAITILTSRAFDQDIERAMKAAAEGPVFITDRGQPTHSCSALPSIGGSRDRSSASWRPWDGRPALRISRSRSRVPAICPGPLISPDRLSDDRCSPADPVGSFRAALGRPSDEGRALLRTAPRSPLARRGRSSRTAGWRGRPGMVMMSPQIITTKPAPAESRTSRTGTTCPLGAPSREASAEKEYCVLATQIGSCEKPIASISASRAAALASSAMSEAP